MEAELGEMDAEGRSERPPYAPGKKKKKEEGKIESSRSYSLGGLVCLGPLPHQPGYPGYTGGQLAEMLNLSSGTEP